ncbi:MAG: S8 family serine peptidase [Catenulispora sp.]
MATGHYCRAARWSPHSGLVRAGLAVTFAFASTCASSASTENQWALRFLNAERVWQLTRGTGIRVAVVDTGVQSDTDLANSLTTGADFSAATGQNVGDGLIDTDSYGHGTGEASLIAGSGSAGDIGTLGLAPEADIVPVRASENGMSAKWVFGAAPAVEYATSHGCRVINLAFALGADSEEIHHAIQDAITHDVVVVAAVGNDGTSQQYYPAAWPGVVGVGAIDSSGNVWERSNTGPDVALVAPGVHILRDDNRGRVGYSDGTSEATAYVSAAAALVRSAHPAWSAAEVVAALKATAYKPAAIHGAARDDRYGAGILNVLGAVSLARPPDVGGVGKPAQRNGTRVWWWVIGGAAAAAGGAVAIGLTMRRRRGA